MCCVSHIKLVIIIIHCASCVCRSGEVVLDTGAFSPNSFVVPPIIVAMPQKIMSRQ